MRSTLWVLLTVLVFTFGFSPSAKASNLNERLQFPAYADLTYGASVFNSETNIKGYLIQPNAFGGFGKALCRINDPVQQALNGGAQANISISLQAGTLGKFDHFSSLFLQFGTLSPYYTNQLSYTNNRFLGFGDQFVSNGRAEKKCLHWQ